MRVLAILKSLFLVTLPSLLLLFCIGELFFRWIIPAAERPAGYFDSNEAIYRFDTTGQREGTYCIGKTSSQKGRWRINNFGWNSIFDYQVEKTHRRIAVIGDSFIEAFQVNVEDTYPSLLGIEYKGKYDVYSFGVSGAPMSEYLHYSRYVSKYFDPDIFIFNIIYNDFDESIFQLNPNRKYMQTLSIDSVQVSEVNAIEQHNLLQYSNKKKLLRRSAIFRYIYYNLKIEESIRNLSYERKSSKFRSNVNVSDIEMNIEIIRQAVDYIISSIRAENPHKRIIFVMDGPRSEIYKGDLAVSRVRFLNKLLKSYCLRYEVEFIDLTLPMAKDYENKKEKFNSELDGHWNTYGHYFVFQHIKHHLDSTMGFSISNNSE